jgi:hypothetical protein
MEGKTDHRRHKYSPRKRKNGGMPKDRAMWQIDPMLGRGLRTTMELLLEVICSEAI